MDILDVLKHHTLPQFWHTPFRKDDTGIIVTIGTLRAAIEKIEQLEAELGYRKA